MKHAIFTTVGLVLMAQTAFAQEEAVCMDSFEMEAALIDWYDEKPSPDDASANRQLWTAGPGGTWTVVTYEPDGQSCVLAQGDNYTPSNMDDALVAALETGVSIELGG